MIYTGLIKTEIGNWNSDSCFHQAREIYENLGGKSQENLVEHQIIKNDKKI